MHRDTGPRYATIGETEKVAAELKDWIIGFWKNDPVWKVGSMLSTYGLRITHNDTGWVLEMTQREHTGRNWIKKEARRLANLIKDAEESIRTGACLFGRYPDVDMSDNELYAVDLHTLLKHEVWVYAEDAEAAASVATAVVTGGAVHAAIVYSHETTPMKVLLDNLKPADYMFNLEVFETQDESGDDTEDYLDDDDDDDDDE